MDIHFKSLGFVLSALCFSPASNLHAASFNCEGSTNEIEQTICNNAELSTLDSILGDLWDDGATRTDELVQAQRAWLAQRNSCGSNADCLKQSYLERLSEEPFYLQSFEVLELYDFQTSEFSEYLAASTYYPYNALTFIYAMDGRSNPRIEWLKPQFTESLDTCGIRVLGDVSLQLETSPSELGWINALNQEYAERPVNPGEVSVYTKWIGHGDMSSEVFYRLVDGRFVPDRALVDNCEDQAREFTSVFFDEPESNLEELEANSATSELQLAGELFDDFEPLAQQCVEESPNMDIIRICLMHLRDEQMREAFQARMSFLRENGVSSDAIVQLNETQESFKEYRSSSCGLILDINYGWIADDAAMNCYLSLTSQRTDFLKTQWLPN
jgi:uncharacterized protein YecT (DUF1311 family)